MRNGSRGNKVGGGPRSARILKNRLKGRRPRFPWDPKPVPRPKATIIWTDCYSPRYGYFRRVEILRTAPSELTRNQAVPEIVYLHKEAEDPELG
jgi:hypothetical protein